MVEICELYAMQKCELFSYLKIGVKVRFYFQINVPKYTRDKSRSQTGSLKHLQNSQY